MLIFLIKYLLDFQLFIFFSRASVSFGFEGFGVDENSWSFVSCDIVEAVVVLFQSVF